MTEKNINIKLMDGHKLTILTIFSEENVVRKLCEKMLCNFNVLSMIFRKV